MSLAISSVARIPLRFRYLIRCPPWLPEHRKQFLPRTLFYFTASVAYIYGGLKRWVHISFFIMLAVTVAYEFTLFTDSYQWMPAVICPPYTFFLLHAFLYLQVLCGNSITGVLFDGIVPDLLCDGSPVPSQFLSKLWWESHVALSPLSFQPVLIIKNFAMLGPPSPPAAEVLLKNRKNISHLYRHFHCCNLFCL